MEKLSVAEIEALRESFCLHSSSSSSLSSSSQLRCILRSLGMPITHPQSVQYFQESEGPVNVQRVLDIMVCERNASLSSFKEIREGLEAACPRSNHIDATQLARILSTTGEKLSGKEIEAFFTSLSPNGQPISFDHLISFIERPIPR